MRSYEDYLTAAKQKNGFKFDSQVDEALGFKGSMTTYLKKGKRHLSDAKMVELARLANMDETIALIDLHYWRTKDDVRTQSVYKKLGDALRSGAIALSVLLMVLSPTAAFAATGAAVSSALSCQMIAMIVYIMVINILF